MISQPLITTNVSFSSLSPLSQSLQHMVPHPNNMSFGDEVSMVGQDKGIYVRT